MSESDAQFNPAGPNDENFAQGSAHFSGRKCRWDDIRTRSDLGEDRPIVAFVLDMTSFENDSASDSDRISGSSEFFSTQISNMRPT